MTGTKRAIVAGALAAIALWSAEPASAAVVVRAKGASCTSDAMHKFVPKAVSVAAGTTVRWKSVCGSHTVTATSSNWSKNTTISVGETTSRTFNAKGVYRYRCRFHSGVSQGKCLGMCGRVVVG